jgi:hypothetical protein
MIRRSHRVVGGNPTVRRHRWSASSVRTLAKKHPALTQNSGRVHGNAFTRVQINAHLLCESGQICTFYEDALYIQICTPGRVDEVGRIP